MSLDQNLFTLVLTPNPDDASVVDLVDPAGTIYYRKQRTPNSPVYSVEVYDFMTESLLVKATAPSATSKTKILELYNPTSTVELKYTGTLTFRWSFKWEGHEFEWKREECYLIRKPDPPVLVAITKEPSGRLKTHTVQLLDYNINRFDIEDRKGLEITMLTALLTFQDANEAYHTPNSSDASILPTALRRNTTKDVSPTPTPPPPLPTKPPAKTGVDRVAELQALRGEYNEVVIEDECDVADYAQYSWNLLQDDAILFVSILASDAPQVPKVLQTVEETKRLRYRAANMDELHQYVVYDTLPAKGPRRINLDSKDKYEAPKSILVHLSKIPMPELQPKPSLSSPPGGSSAGASGSTLLSGSSLFWRRDKGKEKERPKEDKKKNVLRSSSPKVHSHQVHPHQPSPSPSQLASPAIYVGKPPKNRR